MPLDREFGVDTEALDRPTPKAMALIRAELLQAIRKFEPRCKVKRVDFDRDIDGKLSVLVKISIMKSDLFPALEDIVFAAKNS